MTQSKKQKIGWLIRLIIAVLFLLSAIGKLYPWPCNGIWIFEAKYLSPLGFEGNTLKIVSRVLIGFELSLAILILLPYYLKKIIIPVTIGLLTLFSVHLSIQVFSGTQTNCGCFGELIPMTPIQALVKNLLSIGLLIYLYKVASHFQQKRSITPILIVLLTSILLLFVLMTECSCTSNGNSELKINSSTKSNEDSEYAKYFSDINEGNKLLLFLDPTCDHCMEVHTTICKLHKKHPGMIPETRIIFPNNYGDDTPELVNDFFKQVGCDSKYTIVSIDEWMSLFFGAYNTPGVKYLYNGGEILFFEGTDKNAFDQKKLLESIQRKGSL